MHKRLMNTARIVVEIRPRGPLLIKSGVETVDPTRPEMEFVRTYHPLVGDTVYLPGSSLKGAVRSHAERLLLGAGVRVCDPFDRNSTCRRSQSGETTAQTHARQCPICRVFGSLSAGGRCSITDAYPWPVGATNADMMVHAAAANRTERRTQVGIDRTTGAAQGKALFDLEVVAGGIFGAEVRLKNFQLWQLGLISVVLGDIDAGVQRIGFGKSRGLGLAEVSVCTVEINSAGRVDGQLRGLAGLVSESDRRNYKLSDADEMAIPHGIEPESSWRGSRLHVQDELARELMSNAVSGPLTSYVSAERGPGGDQRGT